MRFSVVIQSYLGDYPGAAKDRDKKIFRAIDSVLKQSFQDFEIIIVADGCEKTFDLIEEKYLDEDKIECYLIKKQPIWSGFARNFGIEKAQGEYIVYLDIDDYFGKAHLAIIDSQLEKHDWVYFNDVISNGEGKTYERECLINQKFQNGTSNICHKRTLNVKWNGASYGYDDWSIVNALRKYPNNIKISTPQYIVCHLPAKRLDV